MTQKEINALAKKLYNKKIKLEDIILDYSIEVAGKVCDAYYDLVSRGLSSFNPLDISINNKEAEFYIKIIEHIKSNLQERGIIDNLLVVNSIIPHFSNSYKEKLAIEIFNLMRPYLEKIIISKGNDNEDEDKLRYLVNFGNLSLQKSLELFKSFLKDKDIEALFYINQYLHFFNINDFTLVMDIEKFNNSKLLFSKFKDNEDNYRFYFYDTFISLIDKNDNFVKSCLLNKEDIFKYIFRKILLYSYDIQYDIQADLLFKSRIDRVISIAKETFGEKGGNEYIKENLFKSLTKTNVYTLIGVFPFKDYKNYIPDTKVGEEIKNLLSLNSNKLSETDIKNIKKLPVSEQNKFLSNSNISMDIVKKILGKRFVSQELLSLVKERRPSDYLEFYKLKARQYLINSMKNEFTELKDMGLIEDVIVDFKVPEGQKDSLKLYLGLR